MICRRLVFKAPRKCNVSICESANADMVLSCLCLALNDAWRVDGHVSRFISMVFAALLLATLRTLNDYDRSVMLFRNTGASSNF